MGLTQRAGILRTAKLASATPTFRSRMVEGPLLLSMLVKNFWFEALPRHRPTPVAHLTVRSKSGIWLNIHPRSGEYGVTPPVTEGEF